jgi:hypothetical protein
VLRHKPRLLQEPRLLHKTAEIPAIIRKQKEIAS